jgi:hypothetical protein
MNNKAKQAIKLSCLQIAMDLTVERTTGLVLGFKKDNIH